MFMTTYRRGLNTFLRKNEKIKKANREQIDKTFRELKLRQENEIK